MDSLKVFYLRDTNKQPVACVASMVLPRGEIKYAVATHNPIDKFSKARGREVAEGRVLMEYVNETNGGIVEGGSGAKFRIINEIIANPNTPFRTINAALNWLETYYIRNRLIQVL